MVWFSWNPISKRGFMSHTFDLPFSKLLRLTPLLLILVCLGSVAHGQNISTIVGNTNNAVDTTVCTAPTDIYGDGCPATSAVLTNPQRVTVDQYGNLWIPDTGNSAVRFVYGGVSAPAFITSTSAEGISLTKGNIYTVAGIAGSSCTGGDYGGQGNPSTCGNENIANQAHLEAPMAVAVDSSNNVYIVDGYQSVIWKINATTGVIEQIAGTLYTDAYVGDGGTASSAQFNAPRGMAIDDSGNLYIADTGNNVIRELTLNANSSYTVNTIAGSTAGTACDTATAATSPCGDGDAATLATLNGSFGVFVDTSGNIYIPDTYDFRLRVIYESGTVPTLKAAGINSPTAGSIYTIAGNGTQCTSSTGSDGTAATACGDTGSAVSAQLRRSADVSVDSAGTVFLADRQDHSIRKIDSTGNINLVAGTERVSGYGGDGSAATSAELNNPYGLALDTQGNLYVADTNNSVIRYVPEVAAAMSDSQTITWNQTLSEVTYGATSTIALTATTDSGLAVSYSVSGPASLDSTGTNLTITGAGSVTVTASQAGGTISGKTYAAANSVQKSFTVDKALLTVMANKASVPFGTSVSALTSTYETYTPSGLVGTDSLSGAPAYTITNCSDGNATYTATTVAGTTCTITPTVNTLAISPTTKTSSYNSPFTYVSATLTVVGGDTQTITFPTLTGPFTYGMSPIALSATATSKQPVSYSVDNTSVAVVTGDSTSGYYLTIKGAGQVTVTASQGGNNNYAPAQSVNQVLTIGRATVTVTPGSLLSVPYGSTPSSLPFSYTASSLVATNDQLSGTPTYTTNCGGNTAYSTTTAVGSSCTISVSGLSISPTVDASNYTINYATGTLTVIHGTQTISWLQPGDVYYAGGATQTVTITATATSGLPVTATVLSGPAAVVSGTTVQTTGGGSVLGVGTVTVQLTQGGSTNYAAAAPVTVSFKVNPATLYVKANDLTMAPGATVPTLTWAFTCNSSGGNSCSNDFVGTDTNTPAVVSGLPVLSTLATSTSSTGNYTINIAQGTLTAQNYNIVTVNGTLTITSAPTYIVTANPSTLTIRAGQTGQATILVTPTNGYQGTVTFSCGNLPTNVTCTFSPASLTLTPASSGVVGAQQTTLTVNTNASSTVVGMLAPHQGSQVLTASLFFLPGGLTGLLIAFNRKRLLKHKRLQGLLVLIALLSGLTGLSACGGSTTKSVATAGTNTVTITAAGTGTSGSGSPNATNALNLTVVITQ